MLDQEQNPVLAGILAAADPVSRRLVVRVRPPAAGIDEWLTSSIAALTAPVNDLLAYGDAEDLANALHERGGDQWSSRAGGLRLFAALTPGDVLVAGNDAGTVVAVGLVTVAYRSAPGVAAKHCVDVAWWTSTLPKKVPNIQAWPYHEVCEFRRELLGSLMMETKRTEFLPEPPFSNIVRRIASAGMVLPEALVRRYHVALKTRGFVILAGVSGTGKTWLAELYAGIVGASHRVIPVAPNWTANEDLLGYLNPLDGAFHATEFTRFLEEAASEHREAKEQRRQARPFHLILDEMNLARPEHYFAKFLSAMELRNRSATGEAQVELAPGRAVPLPSNLVFIGTVNVDETTHGFADKVFDRAQLVELGSPRESLAAHLGNKPHTATLMAVWDAVSGVAPFAFRVIDDITHYIAKSAELDVRWQDALDEQVLQKVLPKLKGNDGKIGDALAKLAEVCGDDLPLSRDRVRSMFAGYQSHGFASFF